MSYGKLYSIGKNFVKAQIDFEQSIALIPDTNILLYLVQKDEYIEFLNKLDSLISNNHLILLITEQVLNEFERNLDSVANKKKDTIKNMVDTSKKMVNYFYPFSEDHADQFKSSLNFFEDNKEKIIKRNIDRKIACLKC